jgi:SAM-dependent methyltransferase
LPAADNLPELAGHWQAALAAWAIPAHITTAVRESPWLLPRQVFARRADRLTADPSGVSYDRARAALEPGGTVLDVGSGAGAACLPLLPLASALTAVDSDEGMLRLLADRATALGRPATVLLGRWPEVSGQAPVADVVTCHHVLYNVPDPVPFLAGLTGRARRLVVVEVTTAHPLTSLNPLWLRFHGLRRPQSPTAADLTAIAVAMGLRPRFQRWTRPGRPDYTSFAELVEVTRRRLCLPPERAAEVGAALTEAGIDPGRPADPGPAGREVVTIWWDGCAPGI